MKTCTTPTLAALALSLAAPAQALLIDDFAEPYHSNYVGYSSGSPGFSIPSSLTAAAVPGGTRRMTLAADPSAAGTAFAAINGGSELWAFSTGAQRLNFTIDYGTESAMNLDLSGSAALRLQMYLSTPTQLVVYATTQTTPGANPDGSALSLDLPAMFEQSFDIPLSAFILNSSTGRPVNWADVDGLSFFFSASEAGPYGGDALWAQSLSTVAVPEPASAALLAGGLVLLIGRRKFSRPQRELA
jgi:hypothetical protein